MSNERWERILDKIFSAENNERKSVQNIKYTICIILYIIVLVVISRPFIEYNVKGIISQTYVIVSVYLAVRFGKRGFFTALAYNLFILLPISISAVKYPSIVIYNGYAIAISTLTSVCIVSGLTLQNRRQYKKLFEQKEENMMLYEEITASEEELRQQNEQLKRNEERLNHLSFYDLLTELPNRRMLISRIDFLAQLKPAMSFSFVLLDLDDFKKINDSCGHQIGDLVIKAVGARLNEIVKKEDILARLGGDEFGVIIQRELKEAEILTYVESLKKSLKEPFHIKGLELSTSACFGIAVFPQDGHEVDELMKNADTALNKAKSSGKNQIHFYRKEMKEEILRQIDLEKRLSAAVEKEEFFLVYQPQFDTNKRLRGFEALVRWNNPDKGIISPMQFIPLAEDMGLIIPLGEWILRRACTKLKELQSKYNTNIIMSVNISPVQARDKNFVEMVQGVLNEIGVEPKYLELEITESIVIDSVDSVIAKLNALKDIGVNIALDDFGTGYSSLSYLQMLPIDTLKIDRSFINNIDEKVVSKQIVGSVINLVHQMEVAVVAEGVENEMQFKYLESQNCDYIQGYLLGKPLKEEEMHSVLS